MKSKRFVRIVAIILAFMMVFSVLYAVIGSLTASAAVTQAQIDKLKQAKKDLDTKKQEAQARINTIEYEKMSILAKKNVLDSKISLTEQEIDTINETIETYIVLIAEKELEVIEAQRREDEQLLRYKDRVRRMEENGAITYLEILFDSTTFSDLLARIDFVGDLMRSDESIYKQLIAARLDTIAAAESLKQSKEEQEEEKVQLEEKYLELEEQVAQAGVFIAQLDETLETENALYEELSAEEDKVQREINNKVEELRKQEAAAAAAAAASGNRSGGSAKGTGTLMWPCPASNVVSSQFGNRLHPIYKVYRQHTGIDISIGYGNNIVAADTGTVITSTYSSGYGNYVVVSHGNGMTTLYAHMSSRKVSVGDTVNKGTVVGLVGSTGVSTGPHLHFEVSVNGTRVNPLDYFTGYVLK